MGFLYVGFNDMSSSLRVFDQVYLIYILINNKYYTK